MAPNTTGSGDGDDDLWEELQSALCRVDTPHGRPVDRQDTEWALQEARFLVLDGRADLPTLRTLVLRGCFGAWATLRDSPTGTAELLLAVLVGWDAAGVAGTGRGPSTPAGDWDGTHPYGPVEVAAVCCAAAAHRLGLTTTATHEWAAALLLDPGHAPEPEHVHDPTDGDPGPQAGPDEAFLHLRRWLARAGAADAPLCFRAGLTPAAAAVLIARPADDPRRVRVLGHTPPI